VLDAETETVVTAYGEDAVKYIAIIKADDVIRMNSVSAKVAKPEYSRLACSWELILTRSSKIDTGLPTTAAPPLSFQFMSINEILTLPPTAVFGNFALVQFLNIH
jgi:hypothetical protein